MPLRPGQKKYNYEIELQDTRSLRRYGLKVPQGSLQIGVISQDDTVYIRNVGKRVGDFDEQRSWKGGRGVENFSDNAEGYFDSKDAWTLTPGHVHQTLQWWHARGLRSEDLYMPSRDNGGAVRFQPLLGATRFIANSFAASASYSARYAFVWLRRKGTPGDLVLRFRDDSTGSPGTATRSVTITTDTITDYLSVYQMFDLDPAVSLTGAVTYWVSAEGSANDDKDNHWEIGVNPNGIAGKYSSDGSVWVNSTGFAMYYRVTDAAKLRKWHSFTMKGATYVVEQKDSGAGSCALYINGDRGKASSATSTSIVDSTKTWIADRWQNARVYIWAGTGLGQSRRITTNSTNTLSVDSAWDITPDNTSQYLIYSTDWFTSVATVTGAVTGKPVVANNVAYIPQGTAGIYHITYNTSTAAHDTFSETPATTQGTADILFLGSDQTSGAPVLWRANNSGGTGSGGAGTVSVAPLTSAGAFIAWNATPTFATAIFTGFANHKITNFAAETGERGALTLYVLREDGVGKIYGGIYTNMDTGIEKTPDRANGVMAITHKQFVYFSWLHSVIRIFNSTYDDIGEDYRKIGLPDGREGEFSDADTYLSLVLMAVDAGKNGTSSVMAWDGLAFHEIVRARRQGERCRMVKFQPCVDTRGRVWSNMGDDLVVQEVPLKKASPRLDAGCRYMHEAVVESAAIDMGTASGLPKYINELVTSVKNLNIQGREIHIDYQFDDDVHTNNWTYAGTVGKSPESVQFLGLENIRRFAYRLRINSDDPTVPIDIEGIVPSGYARTPFKMVFTLQVQAGGIYTRRGKTASSGELVRWLLDASRQPGRVKMTSVFELAHNWNVIIHPPKMFPMVPQKGKNPEQSTLTLVLQEV